MKLDIKCFGANLDGIKLLRFRWTKGLSALIVLLVAFPVQMGLYAAAQSGSKIIAPSAIPDATPIKNITFFGTTLDGRVTATLDNGGTDQFFEADDPDNEIPTAMAYSKKTGRSYIGVVAASGPKQRMGKVNILDSAGGDPGLYSRGRKRTGVNSSIQLDNGTPVGMAALDSTGGDILIVASVFFPQDVTIPNPNADVFSITAFLPDENGIPSGGRNKRVILPAGSSLNTGEKINFSFGGLAAADVNGEKILYANVVNRKDNKDKDITGAIIAFNLGKDGIAENPPFTRFISPTAGDPNPMTASSIVPFNDGGKMFFAVYGVNDAVPKLKTNSQISIYGSDGKFNRLFFSGDPKFQGALRSFGSAMAVTHMNFVEGAAFFSFAKFDSNSGVSDSGLAKAVASGGAAVSSRAPMKNGLLSFITMVQGVPDFAAQQQPFAVAVDSPKIGDVVRDDRMLEIEFTSSGGEVGSYDISLSTDGGDTFPIDVVSNTPGISGSKQTFAYRVPPAFDARDARLQVIARSRANKDVTAVEISKPFDIQKTIRPADEKPAEVKIESPVMGQTLPASKAFAIKFSSSTPRENPLSGGRIVAHAVLFSEDGNRFNVIAKLSGDEKSFAFTAPAKETNSAAVRVLAFDDLGNVNKAMDGTVGMLKIEAPDTANPKARKVKISPKPVPRSGAFSVEFSAADNLGLASYEIQFLSSDLSGNPLTLGMGSIDSQPGMVMSFAFAVSLPPDLDSSVNRGTIRVIVSDKASNQGIKDKKIKIAKK